MRYLTLLPKPVGDRCRSCHYHFLCRADRIENGKKQVLQRVAGQLAR